jgi:hypothetical protein
MRAVVALRATGMRATGEGCPCPCHGLAAASPYIMQLLMHGHSRLWPHIQER